MIFTCSMCVEILQSPDDPVIDALHEIRNLDRASQIAVHHIHEHHKAQWEKAQMFAQSCLKFYALSSLIPTQGDAVAFISGMEKLRCNVGAIFAYPDPREASGVPHADPSLPS